MTRDPWYVTDAHERGRLIAAFVATLARSDMTALRAGVIASAEGCPIRPGQEAQCLADAAESDECGYPDHAEYHRRQAVAWVGSESHSRRVTQALDAAVKDGLVAKVRRGRGPWRYYATNNPEL